MFVSWKTTFDALGFISHHWWSLRRKVPTVCHKFPRFLWNFYGPNALTRKNELCFKEAGVSEPNNDLGIICICLVCRIYFAFISLWHQEGSHSSSKKWELPEPNNYLSKDGPDVKTWLVPWQGPSTFWHVSTLERWNLLGLKLLNMYNLLTIFPGQNKFCWYWNHWIWLKNSSTISADICLLHLSIHVVKF